MSNDHIMTTTKASIEATMKRKLRYWDNSLDELFILQLQPLLFRWSSIYYYRLAAMTYTYVLLLYTAIILYNVHSPNVSMNIWLVDFVLASYTVHRIHVIKVLCRQLDNIWTDDLTHTTTYRRSIKRHAIVNFNCYSSDNRFNYCYCYIAEMAKIILPKMHSNITKIAYAFNLTIIDRLPNLTLSIANRILQINITKYYTARHFRSNAFLMYIFEFLCKWL